MAIFGEGRRGGVRWDGWRLRGGGGGWGGGGRGEDILFGHRAAGSFTILLKRFWGQGWE